MLPINRRSSALLRSSPVGSSSRSLSSRSSAGVVLSERAWAKSASSDASSLTLPFRPRTTSSFPSPSSLRQIRSLTTTTSTRLAESTVPSHDLPSLPSSGALPESIEASETSLTPDAPAPSFSSDNLRLYPDLPSAQAAILAFSSKTDNPSTSDYLVLLEALAHHRRSNSSLRDILTTYNQIVSRKMTPTSEIISIVIELLCIRDFELSEKPLAAGPKVAVPSLAIRPLYRTPIDSSSPRFTKLHPLSPFDSNPFPSAVSLLSASQNLPQPIPVSCSALTACVQAAGRRLHPELAKSFVDLSRAREGSDPELGYRMYEGLIASFGGSGADDIKREFEAFRVKDEAGQVKEDGKSAVSSGVDGRSAVWNAAILALVQVGDVQGAQELCQRMIEARGKQTESTLPLTEPETSSSSGSITSDSTSPICLSACRSTFVQIASHPNVSHTYTTSNPNTSFIGYAQSLGISPPDLIPIIQPAIVATSSDAAASHQILQAAQKWLGKEHLPSDWLLSSLVGLVKPEGRETKMGSMSGEEKRRLAAETVELVGPKHRKEIEPALEVIILEIFGEQGGFERIARWHDELFTKDDMASPFTPSPLPNDRAPLPHPPQKYAKYSAAHHHHLLISHLLIPPISTTLSPALQLQLILTLVSVASSRGVQTKALALTADAIFYFTALFRDATTAVEGDLTQLISTQPWIKAMLELAVTHDEFRQLKLGRESSYILPTLLLQLTQAKEQLVPEPLDLPNEAWLRIAKLVAYHTPRTPQLSVDLLEPFISSDLAKSLRSSIPSYPTLSKIEFDYSSAPWQSLSTPLIATSASPSPDPTLSERFSTLSDLAALIHKGSESSLKAAYDQVATLLSHETPVVPAYWLLSQLAADLAEHTHSHSRVIQLARFVQSSSHSGKSWDGSDPAVVHANFVVAFSRCGDYASAEWHYRHLLSLELRPDNRVFSALIGCAPDPEGDASVAEKHWDEANDMRIPREEMFRGVYNALLKGYTQAGLREKAVDLVGHLKRSASDGVRFKPNWATYAMLISVHLKAGHVGSALSYYKQMRRILPQNAPLDVHLKAYPFHEMMIYYIHHEPSRAGFVSILNDMKSFGQAPLPQTYDLMMRAHAHFEPKNEAAVQAAYDELVQSGQDVTDEIRATLIRSLRASSADSASAIAAFNSIMSSSPSSKSSAVLYEAVIDACKSNANNELASTYLAEMAANVRLEQDASALLRSFAVVGKMDEARALFESMVDPDSKAILPTERDLWPLPSSSDPSPTPAPAYRTPFVWKTMVENEHQYGDEANARALIERLKAMEWSGISRPNAIIRHLEEMLEPKPEPEPDAVAEGPNSDGIEDTLAQMEAVGEVSAESAPVEKSV